MNGQLRVLQIQPAINSVTSSSMALYAADLQKANELLGSPCKIDIIRLGNAKTTKGKVIGLLFKLLPWCDFGIIRIIYGKYDVIHFLDNHYFGIILGHKNVHVTVHDCIELYNKTSFKEKLYGFKFRLLPLSTKIFAISKNTRNDLIHLGKIQPNKIILNYYGIDESFDKQKTDVMLSNSKLNQLIEYESYKKILYIGSNLKRKNIPTVLKTFKVIKEKLDKVILIKVGDLLSKSDYQKLIISLDLKNDIVELGTLEKEEIVKLLTLCDLKLFPSILEGFGRPILEAYSCGLPIVLSNSSSLKELAIDKDMTHNPEDFESAAEIAISLLTNCEVRDEFTNAGLKLAKKFSWSTHFQNIYRT